MLADHEALAAELTRAAFTAYGLADQWQLAAGTGAEVEHRGMELDELDIPQPGAGAERGRNPIPVETGGFVVTA